MILSRVTIENYKQYLGPMDVDIPAEATIGVIGENGAGKTTLFEAIEWCLYAPRSISPSDIRPRHAAGPTTVTVYLQSVDGAHQYIVQRILKRTPTATVFRVDESGDMETVVQGPKQVSDYVATSLIGLSHTAFTATFFTRQKELHLFGDQAPGKRREEVGRLLGLETIRTAQRSFVAERSKAAAEAKAMATQYDGESEGRNFEAELAAAEAVIGEAAAAAALAAEANAAARTSLEQAEVALSQALQRRDQSANLGGHLRQLERDRASLEARHKVIVTDLNRIANRVLERDTLLNLAGRTPALQVALETQKHERERYLKASGIDRALRDIEQNRRDLAQTVGQAVRTVRLRHILDGWLWSADDMLNPHDATGRLLAIIDCIDVSAAESRLSQLRASAEAHQRHEEQRQTLHRYQSARRKLETEEQSLLSDGDPRDRIPGIDRDRDALLERRSTLQAKQTTLEGERDKVRQLIGSLERQDFGDACPTCGRAFTDTDASEVAGILRGRVTDIGSTLAAIAADITQMTLAITALDDRRKQIFVQIEAIDEVRRRIAKSAGVLDSQEHATQVAWEALNGHLTALNRAQPPTQEEIESARRHVMECHALQKTRMLVNNAHNTFEFYLNDESRQREERAQLGEIAFDQATFDRLHIELRDADRAQATIVQIDQDIARQPALTAERGSIESELSALQSHVSELVTQRDALAFDENEPLLAQQAVRQAQDAERQSLASFHKRQGAIREGEMQRDAVTREQARLQALAARADARRADADHLELMAKEMTEFERYAANRKVPVLGDYTSAIVSAITDGRYDRVEFDQDFGIRVVDGETADASYPVDSFSGGERDAITLAARIALSQMIGRQAANPPGFLVLDEVFGSLDADRRSHLLDLLGTISGTFESLRQVFIISHVDDVRTSPALDEIWRIEDNGEGSSQVTTLSPGAEIDTL